MIGTVPIVNREAVAARMSSVIHRNSPFCSHLDRVRTMNCEGVDHFCSPDYRIDETNSEPLFDEGSRLLI